MNIPSWISTLGVVRHSRRRLSIFTKGNRQKQQSDRMLHGNVPKSHKQQSGIVRGDVSTYEKSSTISSKCCFSNVRIHWPMT